MSSVFLIPLRTRLGVVNYARIDAEDAVLGEHRWCLNARGYVVRNVRAGGMQRRTAYLHRDVLGLVPGDGLEGDHRNLDKLDNRRSNLRTATRAQNAQNLPAHGSSSQYRGVCWDRKDAKWLARVRLDGHVYNLGGFDDEIEAARVASAFRAAHMPFAVEAA